MKLKPCPFCGSENVEVLPRENYLVSAGVKFKKPCALVECFSCFAVAGFYKISKFGEEEAKRLAAEAWNRRKNDLR